MRDENTTIVDDYKDSLWGKFLLETIRLDRYHEKPKGWHWFCAFKDLADSDLKEIQQYLPEQHPFKHETAGDFTVLTILRDVIAWLRQELENTGNIKEIDFSGRAFKNVDFSFFVFPIKVSFKSAAFIGDANFNKATFWGEFNLATANVAKAYAEEYASNGADFTKTTFTGKAIFTETDFRDTVKFSDAKFRSSANFIKTIFFDFTDFDNAIFESDTSFNSAEFSNPISFDGASFLKSVNFSNAIFSYGIIFDGATFEGHTNFINTKFKKCVPTFHKTDIHSNISWSKVIKHWPSSRKLTDEIISYNQNAYENLVSHMKKLDKYHDEHFFYRQEMRCRRASENFFIRFPYAVYDAVSDYGYSIGWAFCWWLGHILLGAFAIWFNTEKSCNNVCDLANNPLLDLAISFSNAHGLLPFHNGPLKRCYEHFAKDDIFNIIWGVQTVVGIPLLFLLLLTLRIRFRLK